MLELKVSLGQGPFHAGEEMGATVTLRNAGSEPVTVNGRLALNAAFAPKDYRDVALLVSDPQGAPVPFEAKVNIGSPAARDFKTLQPGEAVQHRYDLASFYDLQKPGTYSLQAVYQNQSEPGTGNGAAWKGELKSAVERLTVV
jgi:hypothetical protein